MAWVAMIARTGLSHWRRSRTARDLWRKRVDALVGRLGLRASEDGRALRGVVAGHRISIRQHRHRSRDRQYGSVHELWITVHLARNLQLDQPDRLSAFPERRGSGLLLEDVMGLGPGGGTRRAAALRAEERLAGQIRLQGDGAWQVVLLDRAVCVVCHAAWPDAEEIAARLQELIELAESVAASRRRVITPYDRASSERLVGRAAATGLRVEVAPPRLVGVHGGYEVELHTEPARGGRDACLAVRVRLPETTGAFLAFERGDPLACANEWGLCDPRERGEWRLRAWTHEPRLASHRAIEAALEGASEPLGSICIDGRHVEVGFRVSLPLDDRRALEEAISVARAIEAAAAPKAPYRG